MLFYGSECWAMNKADRRKVQATKMKLLRCVARYDRKDQVRNDHTRQKLKLFYLSDCIQQNKKNLYENILRMDPRRTTQKILRY
jgi:hypothetical protein